MLCPGLGLGSSAIGDVGAELSGPRHRDTDAAGRIPDFLLDTARACLSFAFSLEMDPTEDHPPAAESPNPQAEQPTAETVIDPLSVNATCYVCHMMFVREEISRQHLAEKITCIRCHGLSAAHANDEDIGATKPDITYRRDGVDAMCQECHPGHDVSASAVIGRFLERKLTTSHSPVNKETGSEHTVVESGEDDGHRRLVSPSPQAAKTVCTDCHGHHRIDAASVGDP